MERNRGGRPRHPDVLTPAEWRVLDALREGGTNAEIASRLGLSLDTVKTHISNMLAKLELRDRRALAAWRPDARRRRLGGVLAVPAALWSVGRPLTWVGAGVAALAGVAVVVVALVALEGIVEGDGPPPTVRQPDATASASASLLSGLRETSTEPDRIRAVYMGAPDECARVVDIPEDRLRAVYIEPPERGRFSCQAAASWAALMISLRNGSCSWSIGSTCVSLPIESKWWRCSVSRPPSQLS